MEVLHTTASERKNTAMTNEPTRVQGLLAALWAVFLCWIAILEPKGGLAMTEASEVETTSVRKAVVLYASFDDAVKANLGGGELTVNTRFGPPAEAEKHVFEKGFNENVFRIAKGKGVHGGALEVVDVLPNNGRIFFPAKGNIAFKKEGWDGAVSLWINTDPTELIKSRFCDPVQITQKGANNGGIWCDFNDAKPRDMRMGIFPAARAGQSPIKEDDPQAPLIRVPRVGFKAGEWHHLVLNWKNCDTGKADAHAAFYVDGRLIGDVKDRDIPMDWDLEKAGIYVAVNYVGLLDEFAVFNRSLTPTEIELLHQQPALLSGLGK